MIASTFCSPSRGPTSLTNMSIGVVKSPVMSSLTCHCDFSIVLNLDQINPLVEDQDHRTLSFRRRLAARLGRGHRFPSYGSVADRRRGAGLEERRWGKGGCG